MRIACPACEATYDVPDAMVAPARKVRCAKCHHTWVPTPAPPGPSPPGPSPPETPPPESALLPDAEFHPGDGFDIAEIMAGGQAEPMPETIAPPHAAPALRADPERLLPPVETTRRGRVTLALAWLVSIALLGGFGYASVRYRETIMAHWPPSERAYAMLHLMPH